MLAKLQTDLDMAVEQMPDDWDETSCNGISFAAASCSISTALRIACAASPTTMRCGPEGCDRRCPSLGEDDASHGQMSASSLKAALGIGRRHVAEVR
jgi:hypothetical protein